MSRLGAAWEKRTKSALGPAFARLLDVADEEWLSSDLLIDDPGTDRRVSLAKQKSAGIHVLGRTPTGVFGVSMNGSPPISDRPIFFGGFDLEDVKPVATNLVDFLLHHPSLRTLRARMVRSFADLAPTARQPAPRSVKAAAEKPVAKRARSVAAQSDAAYEDARAVLVKLGPAVMLVFDVARGIDQKKLELELSIQLPSSLEGSFTHPLIDGITHAVQTSADEAAGAAVEIAPIFASIYEEDAEPFARLRDVVGRCKNPGQVLEMIDAAEDALRR